MQAPKRENRADVLVLMNAQTGEVESVKHELDERDRAMIKGIIK